MSKKANIKGITRDLEAISDKVYGMKDSPGFEDTLGEAPLEKLVEAEKHCSSALQDLFEIHWEISGAIGKKVKCFTNNASKTA